MRKALAMILALVLVTATLAGCSQRPEGSSTPAAASSASSTASQADPGSEAEPAPASDVVLEVTGTQIGVIMEKTQEIFDNFTAETGIQIEYSTPGNYEDVMRTRMASNDLPDLFDTHGWSVARYSEYLRPLNDQAFVADIVPAIQPMVTDSEGNVFVLPVNTTLRGVLFNTTVLESAGVNYQEIVTWADFEAACDKVKAAGAAPISVGGKDSWPLGELFNIIAPTLYTNEDLPDAAANAAAFQDGSFDWSKWGDICEMLDKWTMAGYFNTDALTADYATSCKLLATGEAAFGFYPGNTVAEILVANADASIGMMAIPARETGGKPSLVCGELYAFGVWKDSEHQAEALQLLEYMAKPENCSAMATALASPAGLKGVDSETGILKPYYDAAIADNTYTIPFFDRIYLPSGMYDDLCITGGSILAQQPNAVQDAVAQMEQSYLDKMAA